MEQLAGIYQVTTNINGILIKAIRVKFSIIPEVVNGFCQKIDNTHYLIGTKKKGIYQIVVDNNGMVIKSVRSKLIPDVYEGFSQKIDDTHYLIGTREKGVFQVKVNKEGIIIQSTHISQKLEPISIPNVVSGFSTKIDDTHYLIGTFQDGLYEVTVNKDGAVIHSQQYFKKN